MKTYSCQDVVLASSLSHLKPLDLLDPQHDKLLGPVLHILGMDLTRPISFIPCQHRTLQGKVVVSFLIAGEVRGDKEFLLSSFCSAEDRIIAAGYKDISLAHELAQTVVKAQSYGNGEDTVLDPSQLNDNEDEIVAQINQLSELLLSVRGDAYNKDGSLKCLHEYSMAVPEEKKRKTITKKTVAKS